MKIDARPIRIEMTRRFIGSFQSLWVRDPIHRTAVYVTRSLGGVGGRGREASSYPD